MYVEVCFYTARCTVAHCQRGPGPAVPENPTKLPAVSHLAHVREARSGWLHHHGGVAATLVVVIAIVVVDVRRREHSDHCAVFEEQ